MARPDDKLRETLATAQRQSVIDWLIAYAAGATFVWVAVFELGQYLAWPDAVARLAAIAFALGLAPVLVLVWNRDFDYEPERTRRALRAFALACAAIAVALWHFAPQVFTPSLERILAESQQAASAARASIAVRPFVAARGTPSDDPLVEGIHLDLVQRLGQVPMLSVTPLGAIADLPADATAGEVARAVSARFVLASVLARDDDRVRVTVTLTEGPDAALVWRKDFERPVAELLALEASLAEQVARSVVEGLDAGGLARLRRNPTESPAAYEAFLRGQHHLRNATPDSRAAAISEFRRAILLDPEYARAWAGLADAYNFRADLYLPQEVWPVSSALARRAVAIDPSLPEVQASLARILAFYDWNLAEAEVVLRRALSQGARCGDETRVCETYFFVLYLMGRCDDSLAITQQLVAARPRDAASYRRHSIALACAKRYPEAIDALERSAPFIPAASTTARASHLAMTSYMQALVGHALRANQLAREAVALAPQEPIVLVNAGIAFGITGDKAGSNAVIELFDRVGDLGLSAPRTYRAAVLAGVGRKDEALTLLEAALANREVVLLQVLNDPGFDPLRGEPRFRKLVERMGGAPYARSTRNM